MSTLEKLKIFKYEEDKYHFKTKDDRHIEIEHKERRLKFKLHKWSREASIEVFLNMVEADKHTFSGNKIELEDSTKKIRVYPIDTRTTGDLYGDSNDVAQCQDGGLRHELIYKEKPPTNFFDTPLVCENTRWSKQPFLTPEDITRGSSCPLNVEGSYAVYHISKKNNEYMTGKFGHWYRPIAIDALGNKAWCDLEVDRYIDPTNMRVTVPQQFLDEATYPVTVDPDFGYKNIGGLSSIIGLNGKSPGSQRHGSAWEMHAPGGTANWMRAYVSTSSVARDLTVFINQKDSGGAGIHAQIATKENLAVNTGGAWIEFTLGDEELTEAVDYILNIMAEVGATSYIYYDTDGATALACYYDAQTYGAPESPWTAAAQFPIRDNSIYVDYDEPVLGWTGKISGITNPAKIMGIDVADIAKVKGIA